jgi:pyruvate formate lyase activating enzyme
LTGIMEKARWWKTEDNQIRCTLCPWECLLKNGQTGICKVRRNIGGELMALSYGRPLALSADPMEKKPLYHFLPGKEVFSIGTAGCNLLCDFCQNWEISQSGYDTKSAYSLYSPEEIIRLTQRHQAPAVAFTYNEPTVFAEYVYDIAAIAREKKIKTVMVSNGYILPKPARDLYALIDAANIDLKSFQAEFYQKRTKGQLKYVLDTLLLLREMNIHLEITTLIIDGYNNDAALLREEFSWIEKNLGANTAVHLSAFHPDYKMTNLERSSAAVLESARQIARDAGLNYVYLGNIPFADNNTYCPNCAFLQIRRNAYDVQINTEKYCRCGRPVDYT